MPVLRKLLVALLLIAIGSLLGILLWPTGRASRLASNSASDPAVVDPRPLGAALRSPVATSDEEGAAAVAETRRQRLARYWGSQWPAVEQQLLRAGVDLDVPDDLQEWNEAAGAFEPLIPLNDAQRQSHVGSMVDWHDSKDDVSTWMRMEFNIPDDVELMPDDLAAVEQIASGYNDELLAVAEESAHLLDMHLRQRWNAGAFVKAPYSTHGMAKEKGFFAVSHAAGQWSIVITLKREEYPDLVALSTRATELRRAREIAVKAYFSSRGYY